ncbi:acyltransferase family protein [Bacillus paranthracis]|uniref:acyltransferase family protein n=1 Tax=Bacillus paranthracis TaxID=2026186 RepID=UPI002158894B|nr:acyltransferase [Bacillus paranthracis]MCR6794678.1 acyltransferase [Bacillus paranthracis]MED1168215.1 acyltransferase [Bacillus paranthracis]
MENRMYSLQSIRGIAAILVLLHHASFIINKYHNYEYVGGIFHYGSLGVDLFFILSGFIIYYLHHSDIGEPKRVGTFLKKRTIRVYPAYWIVTLVLVPVYFLAPTMGLGYERDFFVIIKSLLLIPQSHDPILGVGWSLVYEIYFYLIFSLFILTNRKFSIAVTLLWMATTSYLLVSNTLGSQDYILKFLFSPLIVEFLLGCLIAYLTLNYNLKKYKSLLLTGIIGLIVSLFIQYLGVITIDREGIFRTLIYGVPSFFLIFGLIVLEKQGRFKNNKFLTFLGDASYSIYLVHLPAISFLNKMFTSLNLFNSIGHFLTTTICVIIATLAGCGFHILVEKPLLKYMRRRFLRKEKSNIQDKISKSIA